MSTSYFLFFFKQKTAYEMRISDWSSDVCSSDLLAAQRDDLRGHFAFHLAIERPAMRQGDTPLLRLLLRALVAGRPARLRQAQIIGQQYLPDFRVHGHFNTSSLTPRGEPRQTGLYRHAVDQAQPVPQRRPAAPYGLGGGDRKRTV